MFDWIDRRIAALCCLAPGDLSRLGPFFVLYAILFAALTMADGMALTLFLGRVGADRLPLSYGLTAIGSMVAVGAYLRMARHRSAPGVFQSILIGVSGVFLISWAAGLGLLGDAPGRAAPAVFFAAREIALVLVLAHFGTFLQEYFTRVDLNRILPIVYAGGRFGGLAGGAMLEHLGPALGVLQLAPVISTLMLAGAFVVAILAKRLPPAPDDPITPVSDSANASGGLARSPLFRCLVLSSGLFMIVRWFLNYEYNHFFEHHFSSEAELAAFLGWYTQWALLASFVVQLFVVNRLVRSAGLRGAVALTVVLLLIGMGRNLWELTLLAAVWSRLLETELRFGLRNPINQLVTNQFSRPDRLRVRAWTLGALNPVAALIGSIALGTLQLTGLSSWIPPFGFALALLHALASLALIRHLQDPASASPTPHPSRAPRIVSRARFAQSSRIV
ncbi:hypothetical protein [Tautonia rosea]|uniref:hypothetical protein n=1 Tax=Tautonia rosea TaxID=2728037 RepID=UPI001474B5A9|nr:hypothetical protein [Tautonia rosea]